MAQSIEEQLEIMKAYAEGKPVYRRSLTCAVGEMVDDKGHQFNFERSIYSLTPMDWCTGKEAKDAYKTFLAHGSEKDNSPSQYEITLSKNNPCFKDRVNEYHKMAMDTLDTYAIFIAGAEWVLRNGDKGIDFQKSLGEMRAEYVKRQEESYRCMEAALNRS